MCIWFILYTLFYYLINTYTHIYYRNNAISYNSHTMVLLFEMVVIKIYNVHIYQIYK